MRIARHSLLLLSLLAACTDAPVAPPPVRQLTLVDGANQLGTPGEPLPRAVVVQLKGRNGAPMAGAAVMFRVTSGGGHVLHPSVLTDATGRAAATWILGPDAPLQHLVVSAPDATPITITASTEVLPCAPAECAESWHGEEAFSAWVIPTYDGSGQAVHPDVASHGATGRLPLLMAFTPYPFGNAGEENPSLVESANARHWRLPTGLDNPVARPLSGHLSDPDLVLDPGTGMLHLYYREVAGGRNLIRHLTSRGGLEWEGGDVVLDVRSHAALSPAVTRNGHDANWSMWTVNSGTAGCSARESTVEMRRSANGTSWGTPVTTNLAQPGQVIWHLDVQWVSAHAEYWALYNSYTAGSTCVTRALFLARSTDGVHWTTPTAPLLTAGVAPALRDVVYRSTFRLSPDGQWLELMVSGARYESNRYNWQMGRMVMAVGEALTSGTTQDHPDDVAWRLPVPPHLPPPEPGDMP